MTDDDLARARQWIALIEAAARDFGFRPPPATPDFAEGEAYLRDLIRHVERRDWARGFELRVGVRQAEWTPAQAKQFADRLLKLPFRDPQQFARPYSAFLLARAPFADPPVSDETLRRIVDSTLHHLVELREAGPAAELPVFVCGLLTTGALVSTVVSTEDRLPLVHLMARHEPLFGWVVAADMFIHQIKAVPGAETATKQDAIGVHFGSRQSRGFLVVPYAVVDGRVRREPEQLQDFTIARVTDPYAFVFVPPTTGAPS